MRRAFRYLHKNQSGFISIFIAVVFTIVSGLWAYLNVTDRVIWNLDDATSTPTLPSQEPGYEWNLFGYGGGVGGIATVADSQWGVCINSPYTIEIQEVMFRLGRVGAGGPKQLACEVWTFAADDGLGTIIGQSETCTVAQLPANTGVNQWQPWHTFYFEDPIVLSTGNNYTVFVNDEGGGSGSWYVNQIGGTPDSVTFGNYNDNVGAWSPTYMWYYWLGGYTSADPTVWTRGYEVMLDGSVKLYGAVENIHPEMEVGFLCSDNYTAIASGAGHAYEAGITGYDPSRALFHYTLNHYQVHTQYSYVAYGSAYGQTWFGSVYNFTITTPEVPLDLHCSVIQNSLDNVRFESEVVGINATGNVTYNISIFYGTNQTVCRSETNEISLATNRSTDGVWLTDVPGETLFDDSTTYFYRLGAAGNDSSLHYSDMKSFTTWNPDMPPWMQQFMQWFNDRFGGNLTPTQIQWWVVAALVGAAWLVAMVTKWKWVGVIGTAAVFVWLITLGLMPTWVVILAVLIAGWIIFKMVYRRAGATGE